MTNTKSGYGGGPAADALKAGFEQATRAYEQGVAINKDNAEAMIQSSNAAQQAAQAIAAEIAKYTKDAVETGTLAAKALQSVKSVDELLKIQLETSKTLFDSYSNYFTRITDIAATTAKEVAEPIEARMKSAADSVAKTKFSDDK
nr:MAG: phasin family protein [Hyphomicrobiales bacterium]